MSKEKARKTVVGQVMWVNPSHYVEVSTRLMKLRKAFVKYALNEFKQETANSGLTPEQFMQCNVGQFPKEVKVLIEKATKSYYENETNENNKPR